MEPRASLIFPTHPTEDFSTYPSLAIIFPLRFALDRTYMLIADVYGNQQLGPLAVAPYPFPPENPPDAQGAAPEHNLPTVQPGSVFVLSSNPAPCSTAVAMLALAQPNMGLQALGVGQAVHVLLRLEGVNAPPQEFPLEWDPNTGTAIPRQNRTGVTAQIVTANFVNDNVGFQV